APRERHAAGREPCSVESGDGNGLSSQTELARAGSAEPEHAASERDRERFVATGGGVEDDRAAVCWSASRRADSRGERIGWGVRGQDRGPGGQAAVGRRGVADR